ncbi:MAG TPA: hypothetical protein VGB52_04750 [Actinomycetota bacterium]
MPTYLRWIAAITSGLTAQFALAILGAAIAVGQNEGEVDLRGGLAILITLSSSIVSLLVALGVNEWLARRYPQEGLPPSETPQRDGVAAPRP